MTTEYGIFTDEGCIESGLFSPEEADETADEYRAEGETCTVYELCPDHDGRDGSMDAEGQGVPGAHGEASRGARRSAAPRPGPGRPAGPARCRAAGLGRAGADPETGQRRRAGPGHQPPGHRRVQGRAAQGSRAALGTDGRGRHVRQGPRRGREARPPRRARRRVANQLPVRLHRPRDRHPGELTMSRTKLQPGELYAVAPYAYPHNHR